MCTAAGVPIVVADTEICGPGAGCPAEPCPSIGLPTIPDGMKARIGVFARKRNKK